MTTDVVNTAAVEDGLIISDLPPGLLLCGRYRVREKIADGAMASVYLANDEQANIDVALKILDPLRGADPVGRARFEREFEVLSRLNHPAIAHCYRLERHGDLDILVLEHVPGETLESRLKRGRFKVPEAVDVAARLAQALESCHSQGILHRDLKPANVVLHPQRGPVILDFGVAWFSSAANLTRTGAVIGSPQYLAPEAFASSVTDARADIYALGVILFEMLTGRPVHLADNVAELAISHIHDEPPSAASIRPGISATLDATVSRAIAPRAEERLATAAELAAALKAGQLAPGAKLQSRLPCRACRAPLIIDLPFCPGCGTAVVWRLEKGPYAVQLTEVKDVEKCMAWLTKRHGEALASRKGLVARRLLHTPVPLIVGASEETAEQLAAEAREHGCVADIVRARAIIGASLKTAAATPGEILAALGLHYAAVSVVGALMILVDLASSVAVLPGGLGVAGVGLAWWYVRRPVLRCTEEPEKRHGRQAERTLRDKLAALTTDRARRLAAGAVARAATVLVDKGSAPGHPALQALHHALDQITDLDAHAAYLGSRSRSRLAAELVEARAKAERGDTEAMRRVAELETERSELTEVSLAHDLAARKVLEATEAITRAYRRD
ncbi:MAG: serine/threonine-protein kinase [Myxococcota bacterium]